MVIPKGTTPKLSKEIHPVNSRSIYVKMPFCLMPTRKNEAISL